MDTLPFDLIITALNHLDVKVATDVGFSNRQFLFLCQSHFKFTIADVDLFRERKILFSCVTVIKFIGGNFERLAIDIIESNMRLFQKLNTILILNKSGTSNITHLPNCIKHFSSHCLLLQINAKLHLESFRSTVQSVFDFDLDVNMLHDLRMNTTVDREFQIVNLRKFVNLKYFKDYAVKKIHYMFHKESQLVYYKATTPIFMVAKEIRPTLIHLKCLWISGKRSSDYFKDYPKLEYLKLFILQDKEKNNITINSTSLIKLILLCQISVSKFPDFCDNVIINAPNLEILIAQSGEMSDNYCHFLTQTINQYKKLYRVEILITGDSDDNRRGRWQLGWILQHNPDKHHDDENESDGKTYEFNCRDVEIKNLRIREDMIFYSKYQSTYITNSHYPFNVPLTTKTLTYHYGNDGLNVLTIDLPHLETLNATFNDTLLIQFVSHSIKNLLLCWLSKQSKLLMNIPFYLMIDKLLLKNPKNNTDFSRIKTGLLCIMNDKKHQRLSYIKEKDLPEDYRILDLQNYPLMNYYVKPHVIEMYLQNSEINDKVDARHVKKIRVHDIDGSNLDISDDCDFRSS